MRFKLLIGLIAVLWLSGCQPKLLEDGDGQVVDVSHQSTTVTRVQYYRVEGLPAPGTNSNAAIQITMNGVNQGHIQGLAIPDPHCFSAGQITEEQKADILAQIEALQTVSSASIEAVPADADTVYIEVTYLDQHTTRIYLEPYNLSPQYLVAIDGAALTQTLQDLAENLPIGCDSN